MKAEQILGYIPRELLQSLCLEYKVDHQVKKLDGVSIFQLLLYSFITTRENSYRVMEELYHSLCFAKVAHEVHDGVKFNSIRDRITNIKAEYFEAIFRHCHQKFEADLDKGNNIISFDSTLVAASSKLLKDGMRINVKGDKRYLKFTMGFRKVPVHVNLFADQQHLSEDIALGEAIMDCACPKEDIVVFDRGISSRKVYDSFNQAELQFVTRVNANIRFKVLKGNDSGKENVKEGELLFLSDQDVQLFDKNGKPTKGYLRLVRCLRNGSPLFFLSNIQSLQATEIAHIYKQRWEIEVFFKFIKQQLNFSHLLSRNENGVKVVLYMTLIAAILLTAFKKANNLKGYKIPKLRFANQLEELIIRDIVILCGGNPDKIKEFYNST